MSGNPDESSLTRAKLGTDGCDEGHHPANPTGGPGEPLIMPLPEKYSLHVNHFIECGWCSIFNSVQFFQLHKSGSAFYFQLAATSPSRVVGIAHFTEVEPGYFRSPVRGTFGGFEFGENLRVQAVEGFVAEVERQLREAGARNIEILAPPTNLNASASAVLYNVLVRRGYAVKYADLDCFLLVDAVPLVEKVKHSRRQRIHKCRRDGMSAVEVEEGLREQVYDVIFANRSRRGYPVTMTYEAIQEMAAAFPKGLVFFGAFSGEEMIASSICVWISPAVLYVFYWGDLPGWEKFSPVSLLAETIYDYAWQNGCRMLDLGTSTKDGLPNYGLMDFKHEMGCQEALKLTFVKTLN
jgi:hypothetical protein